MLEEERYWLVKIVRLTQVIILFILINSCTTVASVTAMVGNASTSEKGFTKTLEDTYMMSKILAKITSLKIKNFVNVKVSVFFGEVLTKRKLIIKELKRKLKKSNSKINFLISPPSSGSTYLRSLLTSYFGIYYKVDNGIPKFNNQLAHSFAYNDLSSLEKIFSKYMNKIKIYHNPR